MANLTPNPSYSVTIRIELPNKAGMLAGVTQAIAAVEGNLGHIDLIEHTRHSTIREITVNAYSSEHADQIIQAVKEL
ncbi:MAG: ACT domain-containing protein, partial [Cyanobacteriota bacterium]|nr:ACT domain-containing protein [Cyanobacteriota bacterium]